MDGREPAVFVREELPARALMTAQELFNWLALGVATDRDFIAEVAAEMEVFWGDGPGETGISNPMLFALRERAGELEELDRNLLRACDVIPDWLIKARQNAAKLVQDWDGVPVRDLVRGLERDLAKYRWFVDRGESAASQALEAAVAGSLTVLASPAMPTEFAGATPVAAGKAIDVPVADFA